MQRPALKYVYIFKYTKILVRAKFRYTHNFPFIVIVGILSSMANALWGILLSIAVTRNGNFALTSEAMMVGLLIVPLLIVLYNRAKPNLSFYPIMAGIFFGISNALLLSIFNYQNSAIIYSLIAPTIIVFVAIQVIVKKKRIPEKSLIGLVFGGVVAGAGFILLSVANINIYAISAYDILLSLLLILLYGISGFLLTETGLRSNDTSTSLLTVDIFEGIAILPFMLFSAHVYVFSGLTYALLAGIIVALGTYASFAGFRTLQKSSNMVSYSSIIYILTESDILFLALIYEIFVHALSVYTIFGILLIAGSIWYMSKKSDEAFAIEQASGQ